MRRDSLYPIFFAVTVLWAATLACNFGGPRPGASNFYTATDEAGTDRTDAFSPEDDFFIFFDVSGIEPGTTFQSRWYALNIEGQNPSEPFRTIDYHYEEGTGSIYFQLTSADPWPAGNYKVEVYMNSTKVGEQEFSVQS